MDGDEDEKLQLERAMLTIRTFRYAGLTRLNDTVQHCITSTNEIFFIFPPIVHESSLTNGATYYLFCTKNAKLDSFHSPQRH